MCEKLNLSPWERVQAVKMVIEMKFNYLLSMLYMVIPSENTKGNWRGDFLVKCFYNVIINLIII